MCHVKWCRCPRLSTQLLVFRSKPTDVISPRLHLRPSLSLSLMPTDISPCLHLRPSPALSLVPTDVISPCSHLRLSNMFSLHLPLPLILLSYPLMVILSSASLLIVSPKYVCLSFIVANNVVLSLALTRLSLLVTLAFHRITSSFQKPWFSIAPKIFRICSFRIPRVTVTQ